MQFSNSVFFDDPGFNEQFQPVSRLVRFFFDASREEAQLAAYGQLTRTLAAVEEVIKAVEANSFR